mmetsp:Transcript_16396/g.27778  ORF Transcript_16396/g.27778 Transcript_16396/m.27778 type:complete len:371 (+) Transcript_16396:236-1348(+)
MLYDEVIQLMRNIQDDFNQFISIESIGKTHENRDILMLTIDAGKVDDIAKFGEPQPKNNSILLVGAHHSRELVSVQMPLYAILDLLHGLVHSDQEKTVLLKKNKYLVIPFINTDGSYTIYEQYMKTGELILKRKNNDRRFEFEQGLECPLAEQGVDINRNYGVDFGNDAGPCDESFPGPHPFSEPETKAMRGLLYRLQKEIKFVYNFHSYGPMFIWPYNGEKTNTLHEENPDAEMIFNEIWHEAEFPSTTLSGNAIQTVGYLSNGEANDYIMKEFNIPSVSPELANDDFFSGDFFLPYDFVTRSVLRDNLPWVLHTFKKLAGEIDIDPLDDATYSVKDNSTISVSLNVKNIGLQDWNLGDEQFKLAVLDG